MDYSQFDRKVEGIVNKTFVAFADKQFPYHNLKHTRRVVEHAREIGMFYQLEEEALSVVIVAAWFHDIGHLFGEMQDHEERSVAIMEEYMGLIKAPGKMIAAVAECIRVTRYSVQPENLSESILCDADTYHFGTPYFRETDEAVHREMELRTGKVFPDWHVKSLRMLEEHRFYTEYCNQRLSEGKKESIEWLRSLMKMS